MSVIATILLLAVLAAVVYFGLANKKVNPNADPKVQNDLEEIKTGLQKSSTDLAERIAKSSGETKLDLNKELTGGFQKIQERVEQQLTGGRQEQTKSLLEVTDKLEKKFESLQAANQQQLEAIRGKVEQQLASIGDKVQSKLDENIREGFKHFKDVQDSLKAAEEQLKSVGTVGNSINELNNLLKLPHLRGKFGESQLDQLLTDLLPNHLIQRGANIAGAGQVEFLITFAKAKIPIDSKFPREQVAPLFEIDSDPVKLNEARKKLGEVIKAEATRIAKYIVPEAGISMALMFIPSESLYFEVIRDPKICEDLYSKKKVFPVSPNTLAITLKGISIAYDYYEMAKNVDKTIEEIQITKKHLSNFMDRFEQIGDSLEKAQDSFRKAGTHLSRYTSSITKLTGGTIEEIEETKTPPQLPGGTA